MVGLFNKARSSLLLALLLITALLVGLVGCGGTDDAAENGSDKRPIVFADLEWDTIMVNNRIAQFIVENGYGYETESMFGSTIPMWLGLRRGEVDVYIETWIEQFQEPYDEGTASGDVVDLGVMFDDNFQGMFVPTYMIEGDPARGIEPLTPNLRTVEDLPQYWEVFKDPEDPTKGRMYGGVPGWGINDILASQMEHYGLDEYYNLFLPGSTAAMTATIYAAYEKGEPWFGYFGGPNAIFAKLDLTQIEEPPYTEEAWAEWACGWPSATVAICVNKDLPERAPEVAEFLSNYKITSDLLNEALAYMDQHAEAEYEETAVWFLREKEDVWTQWVPEDVAQKVREAL